MVLSQEHRRKTRRNGVASVAALSCRYNEETCIPAKATSTTTIPNDDTTHDDDADLHALLAYLEGPSRRRQLQHVNQLLVLWWVSFFVNSLLISAKCVLSWHEPIRAEQKHDHFIQSCNEILQDRSNKLRIVMRVFSQTRGWGPMPCHTSRPKSSCPFSVPSRSTDCEVPFSIFSTRNVAEKKHSFVCILWNITVENWFVRQHKPWCVCHKGCLWLGKRDSKTRAT